MFLTVIKGCKRLKENIYLLVEAGRQVAPENKKENVLKQNTERQQLKTILFSKWGRLDVQQLKKAQREVHDSVLNLNTVENNEVRLQPTPTEELEGKYLDTWLEVRKFSHLYLQADRSPVLLSRKFKHVPELLILEIPAETRKPHDQTCQPSDWMWTWEDKCLWICF